MKLQNFFSILGICLGEIQGFQPVLNYNTKIHKTANLYSSSGNSVSITNDVIEKAAETRKQILEKKKLQLLSLLGSSALLEKDGSGRFDPVLASPKNKAPLKSATFGPYLAGSTMGMKIVFSTSDPDGETYEGRTDTFYDLLNSVQDKKQEERMKELDNQLSDTSGNVNGLIKSITNSARVMIPPPLRSALTTYGIFQDDEYIPMRDLFTSPSVSFAYERGWRQGFAAAGFPGADKEFEMACEYFDPVLRATATDKRTTVVDMSCATGLFTRRFAMSGLFDRVLGCDYSASMLTEARRRISADRKLNESLEENKTQLELIQLDVAKIPMQDESVECLHAGAAMHCWPETMEGLTEIHRVLVPGGRFFATTFLAKYFGTIQAAEGGRTGPSRQAFNYFESKDELKDMMIVAGFPSEKVSVEILGNSCAVIRCEK